MNDLEHRDGGWDPLPHLAALIDGVGKFARTSNDRDLFELMIGPYAALRGGLLLDEPGRENVTTEAALRELLDTKINDQEERS